MAAFQTKVKRLIERGMRDTLADLETLPDGTVCGHVVSAEFSSDKTYAARRRRLRRVLEQSLGEAELSRISTLLTYTPEEWTVKLS